MGIKLFHYFIPVVHSQEWDQWTRGINLADALSHHSPSPGEPHLSCPAGPARPQCESGPGLTSARGMWGGKKSPVGTEGLALRGRGPWLHCLEMVSTTRGKRGDGFWRSGQDQAPINSGVPEWAVVHTLGQFPKTAHYRHRPDDREAAGASYCLQRRCGHWGWLPFLKVMWTAIALPKSSVFLQGGTPRGLSFCPATGAQTLCLGQSRAHLSQRESQPFCFLL